MIDIEKAKKEFDKYISNYNPEDIQIALKIRHIHRVTDVAKAIAKDLNLDKEDAELAELIALLHDIGRFEQVKRYHTFSDSKSINHGKFGVELLKSGLIRNFIETPEYDEIIYNAILNHNRDKIDENLDERTKLHSKIVRDADKIDIFNVLINDPIEAAYNGCTHEQMSEDILTDKIYNQFMEDGCIVYKDRKTNADIVVGHISYVFDFNFNLGLKIIKEQNYIEKLINKMNFKNEDTIQKFENMKNRAEEYINQRLLNV